MREYDHNCTICFSSISLTICNVTTNWWTQDFDPHFLKYILLLNDSVRCMFVSLTLLTNLTAVVSGFHLVTGTTRLKKKDCVAWIIETESSNIMNTPQKLVFLIWLSFCFSFVQGWVKYGYYISKLIHSIVLSKTNVLFPEKPTPTVLYEIRSMPRAMTLTT